jgi:hypothetical protein
VITSFRIDNFKCFDHLDVPALSQVNVLGGRNNVGKSSFLEAIFLYYDRLSPQMPLKHMAWRGVSQYVSGAESVFAPIFHRYDTAAALGLEATEATVRNGVEITAVPNSRLQKVSLKALEQRTIDVLLQQRRIRSSESKPLVDTALRIRYLRNGEQVNSADLVLAGTDLELRFEHDPERIPTAVFVGARMLSNTKQDAERFGELDLQGEADRVVEFLRVIEPTIRSLSAVAMEEGALLHADVGLRRKIPINFLGDGVNRLLSVVLAMAQARGGCVLIDEIDSGLHHSVLPNVWRHLVDAAHKFECQVIATTHNYGCLEAARTGLSDRLFQDDFTYIRLDREEGHVSSNKYTFQMLEAALERGWEVR